MSLVLPFACRRRPLALLLAGLCAGSPIAAEAATLYPTVAALKPATPASTLVVSNCEDSGAGSLRQAINDADTGDTVDLTQLSCSTITLTSGAIVMGQADLALVGPGENALTLAGGSAGAGVLYDLGSGGTLHLSGMSIVDGDKYRSDVDPRGGCVHVEGNVVLYHVAVGNCTARGVGSYVAKGGGVYSGGLTYLDNSRVTGNSATHSGGGFASGGGVYAQGGFQSNFSTVSGNNATSLSASAAFGGGVFARSASTVLDSTIADNQSSFKGGGLALAAVDGSSEVVLNSTVSGNEAQLMAGMYARGPLTLDSSTIAFNTATASVNGGGIVVGAGLQFYDTTAITSTIIASNVADRPFDEIAAPAATVLTGSHNLFDSPSTSVVYPSDTIIGDAFLLPLQDNGGVTRTHALGSESPAIDAGTNPDSFANDQRGNGFPRSVGAATDIGAYESNPDVIFANGFEG